MEKFDRNLYDQWEKRWKGAEETERLTPIGQRMYKAKQTAIAEALSGLAINTIIEVGCGLGYTLACYQRAGYDCFGIDISPSAVYVCRNKGLPVMERKLETITETYDLVSSDGMLEHFLNFEPYAYHLTRISRKYVLLIQPNHDSLTGKTAAYLAEILRGRSNMFEYNYRIEDFISVFSKYQFNVVRNRPIYFDVFRLLLFRKG